MYSRQPALFSRRFVPLAALSLSALAALSSGCNLVKKLPFIGKKDKTPETTVQASPPAPKKPEPPQIDYAKIRPNELGRIPVVMYHDIGGTPTKRDFGLRRSVADFEKDLDLLYAAGFRPVNMGDVMIGKIDVPAGMSPVVLTFDDARESQFRLIETDKALKIDPTCAVGVLQEFHKKHPDWGLKGTFFALPKSRATIDSFGQSGLGDNKLQYLVDNGFEIGNHTTFHKNMSRMTPEQIQAEVGNANNVLMTSAPKAKITVVALPMGVYPRNKDSWKYLVSGTFDGKPYSYLGAMMAAYRPIPSPLTKKFNPLRMERIAPVDNDPNGLRNWIKKLSAAGGDRYISDGDLNTVSFPKSEESEANLAKIKELGLVANTYAPFGGAGGSKPIISASETDSTSSGTTGEDKAEKFEVTSGPATTQPSTAPPATNKPIAP